VIELCSSNTARIMLFISILKNQTASLPIHSVGFRSTELDNSWLRGHLKTSRRIALSLKEGNFEKQKLILGLFPRAIF
jgi:hypothetical protein